MDPSASSVSVLFAQLKAGDPEARALLVVRMQDRLRRLTASILRQFPRVQRKFEIDDVLNDLNARLLRAIDAGVHPEGSTEFLKFAGFKLHQLLKDEAAKCRRRGDAPMPLQAGGDSEAPAFDPANDTYDPKKLMEWAEFWEQVQQLPDDERTVFMMHFALQIPQTEIAEELGLDAKPVSRLWLKATMKLQKHLPKYALSSVG